MADVQIYKVGLDTKEAVQSVNDLKENIKILKERLGDLEIGSEEYQKTLDLLKVNQNAVKDAMYATTSSMEDLAESATGTSNSYNSLVHRMASLKEELRATDVSTEEGRKHFEDLAGQIKEVNNSLKEMDELQGNFQRNVGNYPGTIKTWSGSLDALDKGIKATSGDLGKMKNGLDAIAVNPTFVIIGVVASLFGTLSEKVQENEVALEAVNKAGVSLEPVLKLIKGVIEKVALVVADLIGKVTEFVQKNGLISKLTDGLVGVGNTLLKFVIAPFKGVIEAIKIFKEQGVKGLGDASKAFAREMKEGISFKKNFEAGQGIVEGLISGVKDKKPEAIQTAREVGQEVGENLADSILKEFEKSLAIANKKFDEELQERIENQRFADEMMEEENERFNASLEEFFAEQERMRLQDLQDAEDKARAKIQTMNSVVDATSGILGTLADLYESDEKHSEENANKIKALRIASATIETIKGALTAYTQAQELGPIAGPIVGLANASLVTATGVAQIAKIKGTQVSGSGGSVQTPSAIVNAPARVPDIPQYRSVTSASEEERLNYMARDQKVALVMSELELKQGQVKVQVQEASF